MTKTRLFFLLPFFAAALSASAPNDGKEVTYAYDLETGMARNIDVLPHRSKINSDKPAARIGQRILYQAGGVTRIGSGWFDPLP